MTPAIDREEAALAAQNEETCGTPLLESARIQCRNLEVFYGERCTLHDLSLDIAEHEVLALIGPTGCGKSTFLRCLNRMNDTLDDCTVQGQITFEGHDIHAPEMDVVSLRTQVGMIFTKPNPFPRSIYDNIAYGPRLHGLAAGRTHLDELVVQALTRADLWDEVKDRLHSPAAALSSSQLQRLCIARALAVAPKVLLLDDPCSGLDPIATGRVEKLITALSEEMTIIFVTHAMPQASRISSRTAFFYQGHLVEVNPTARLFTTPTSRLTEGYITGRID